MIDRRKRLLPRVLFVFVLAFGLVAATGLMAEAATVTVRMNELSPRPVLNVFVNGVNMNYTVGGSFSSDATFNFNTFATFSNLTDPVLEGGSAGTLVLGFTTPTNALRFAVARNTGASLSPGAIITAFFDGTSNSQTFNLNLAPVAGTSGFAEGVFSYRNRFHGIDHVFITFPGAGSRFAVDNIQFIVP